MTRLDEFLASLSLRQKRSRNFKRIQSKLQRRRKQLERHFASPSTLAKRAQREAKNVLRRKLAGLRGNYSALNTSQKFNVDKLISTVPSKKINSIAKKILPRVVRKEQSRVQKVMGRKKVNEEKMGPVEIGTDEIVRRYASMTPGQQDLVKKKLAEAYVSLRRGSRIRHSAFLNTHVRRAKGYERPQRHSKGGHHRATNRMARKSEMRIKFPGIKTSDMTTFQLNAIKKMLDTASGRKRIKRRSGMHRGGHGRSRNRADARRLSLPANRYNFDRTGGFGLNADYQPSGNILNETDFKRVEKFLMYGMAPRKKLELYKRILRNPEQAIKVQRFRKPIITVLNKLLSLTTEHDPTYHRLRTILLNNPVQEEGK